MKTTRLFDHIFSFHYEKRVRHICTGNRNTHFVFSKFFFQNPAIYVIMRKNCCLALKATDDNATHAHYKLLTQSYTHTYCFSAPKIVTRKRILLHYTHISCLVLIIIFCLRRLYNLLQPVLNDIFG